MISRALLPDFGAPEMPQQRIPERSHQMIRERRDGRECSANVMTCGHLRVAEWPAGAKAPFASVKLFNDIHYRIRFAANSSLIWRDIRSGHHFNVKTRKIEAITIVDRQL
jgi:hypothetical protein